jgi:outer membrane immunogenic protein
MVMRTLLLGTAAVLALMGPATSADLRTPIYKAPPPVAPVWRWTACFVGGHAAALRAKSEDWVVQTPGGDFFGQSLGSHVVNGWLGGVAAGCDYQFAGSWVIGLQGDAAWSNSAGSHDSTLETGVAYHSRVKSLASVSGRLGYAWDRFLAYVRGGAAWERDDYWATTIVLGTAYVASETRPGWTVGVGSEYAFTEVLSGFVEYNHYDLGARTVTLIPQVAGLRVAFAEIKETKSVIRVGLNLRFGNTAAPTAAKY